MRYELHHGDCLAFMKTLDLSSISAVVTDPPYGISYDASHKKYKNGIERDAADWDAAPFDPAPIIALSKPTILWGGNCFASRLPDFAGWLTWVKTARNFADVRQAEAELAWTNCVKRSQVFRHLWIGAYKDSESGVRNIHPTQKPVALMEWCLTLCTKPGDTVFDPYMGSASTGIACARLGRNFIGCEDNARYFYAAQKRMEDECAQLHLFEGQGEQLRLFQEND